jgi:lysozyme
VVNSHNWSAVAKSYGLWVAAYASNADTSYQKPSAPVCGAWGRNVAIYQYSSHGRLRGFNGYLDLDRFYGDEAAWKAFATAKPAAKSKEPAKEKTAPAKSSGGVTVDGVLGKDTVKALQKWLNKQLSK